MEVVKKPILFWIVTGLIIAFVITFSILNRQSVDINFLFIRLSGRLFFVLIIFFLLGFFLGKISHLRKKHKNKKKNDEYVSYIED
jgi:uncharacterized integral membrane protein